MAARATATEVKLIITTGYADATVDAFIATATLMVDNTIDSALMDEVTMKQLEIWLAAHLIACDDERLESETIGAGEDKVQGAYKVGLNVTKYGQQVFAIDHTGAFAKLGNAVRDSKLESFDVAV